MGFYFIINLTVYRYLKIVIIMAKFDLKFIDASDDFRHITTKVYNGMNQKEIYIEIKDLETSDFLSIYLDKSTAIKFAKTLRTEINKITEQEVNND